MKNQKLWLSAAGAMVVCAAGTLSPARAGVAFIDGNFTGNLSGDGTRTSDGGMLVNVPLTVPTAPFVGSSGSGGTSGGLGDGTKLVASVTIAATADVSGLTERLWTPGTPGVRMRFSIDDAEYFPDTTNYSGSMFATAIFRVVFVIDGTEDQPFKVVLSGAFSPSFSLKHDDESPVTGDVLTPGTYFADFGSSVSVDSSRGPTDIKSHAEAILLLPGPGTAAGLGVLGLTGARRRRRAAA